MKRWRVVGQWRATRKRSGKGVEAAGLTLADLSARCGIDQPALSRLENGRTQNPTLDTLWRYAAAVGKRLVFSAEDIPDTRTVSSNARRAVPKAGRADSNR